MVDSASKDIRCMLRLGCLVYVLLTLNIKDMTRSIENLSPEDIAILLQGLAAALEATKNIAESTRKTVWSTQIILVDKIRELTKDII